MRALLCIVQSLLRPLSNPLAHAALPFFFALAFLPSILHLILSDSLLRNPLAALSSVAAGFWLAAGFRGMRDQFRAVRGCDRGASLVAKRADNGGWKLLLDALKLCRPWRPEPTGNPMMKLTLLRGLLLTDAVVLFLLGALLVFQPLRVEWAFHFRDLPEAVSYIIGLWGCALGTMSLGYVVAATNPIRHVVWVQVGIARAQPGGAGSGLPGTWHGDLSAGGVRHYCRRADFTGLSVALSVATAIGPAG